MGDKIRLARILFYFCLLFANARVGWTQAADLAAPDTAISFSKADSLHVIERSIDSLNRIRDSLQSASSLLKTAFAPQSPTAVCDVPHQNGFWACLGWGPDRNASLGVNVRRGQLLFTGQAHTHYDMFVLWDRPDEEWYGFSTLFGVAYINGKTFGSLSAGPGIYTVNTWTTLPDTDSHYDDWFDFGPGYQKHTRRTVVAVIQGQGMITSSWIGIGVAPMLLIGNGLSTAAITVNLSLGKIR